MGGMIWFAGHISRSICERCGTNENVTIIETNAAKGVVREMQT